MIYLLDSPRTIGKATTDFLSVEPDNVGEAPRCPACKRPIGMLRWMPPFRVELAVWGPEFGDIAFGTGGDLLVSERFVSLWRKEALVGLEGFESVDVVRVRRRGKNKESPPRYFHVSVLRSQVAVDQDKSGVEWGDAPTCEACRIGGDLKGWDRIVLETPAAENVFIARGLPGEILADDKFRSFCERNDIESASFVPGPDARQRF
jgi:hypothetical protein